MVTLEDLPASVLRLIVRFTRTRHIPGTSRYASVCRSWRDVDIDIRDEERLQLLLALEGLPPGTLTSTSRWLARHGACVVCLYITYNRRAAHLFKQLPLSTAPLVHLVRLEVDGRDSLVAMAPALPQLVQLTHLKASIGAMYIHGHPQDPVRVVFSARRQPLEAVPCLQQLCPGLRSLDLTLDRQEYPFEKQAPLPLEPLLPASLEQLSFWGSERGGVFWIPATALTPLTALRRLVLDGVCVMDADLLLQMPGLEQLDVVDAGCYTDWQEGPRGLVEQWLEVARRAAPQHLTKLAGLPGVELVHRMPGATRLLSLLPSLQGLRSLKVYLGDPGTGAHVEQLSCLSNLRRLDLALYDSSTEAEAAVSALTSVQQLTYLRLHFAKARVARATWAAVLPYLRQLRVLIVTQELLLEGSLVAESSRLTQLQCIYVEDKECQMSKIAFGLERLLKSAQWPSSLKAVLSWPQVYCVVGSPVLQQYQHPGTVHLSSWHKWERAAEEGRVVCPQRCPHLPRMWELQQVPADGLDNS